MRISQILYLKNQQIDISKQVQFLKKTFPVKLTQYTMLRFGIQLVIQSMKQTILLLAISQGSKYSLCYCTSSKFLLMLNIRNICERHQRPVQYLIQETSQKMKMGCIQCTRKEKSAITINQQISIMKSQIANSSGAEQGRGKIFEDSDRDGRRNLSQEKRKRNKNKCLQNQAAVQRKEIAKMQATMLQILMIILNDDRKKQHLLLEKMIAEQQSLWKQLSRTQKSIDFFNSLLNNKMIKTYFSVLSFEGWNSMKKQMQNLQERALISDKVKRSAYQTRDHLRVCEKRMNLVNILENILQQQRKVIVENARSLQKNRQRRQNSQNSYQREISAGKRK